MAEPLARILLVDDEQTVCQVMSGCLEKWGYAVACASDGFQALAAIQHHGCDLAVIDYMMPGMNGQELAKKLKKLNPFLPVVMVSGYPPKQVDEVDSVHLKPLKAEQLRLIIEKSLHAST